MEFHVRMYGWMLRHAPSTYITRICMWRLTEFSHCPETHFPGKEEGRGVNLWIVSLRFSPVHIHVDLHKVYMPTTHVQSMQHPQAYAPSTFITKYGCKLILLYSMACKQSLPVHTVHVWMETPSKWCAPTYAFLYATCTHTHTHTHTKHLNTETLYIALKLKPKIHICRSPRPPECLPVCRPPCRYTPGSLHSLHQTTQEGSIVHGFYIIGLPKSIKNANCCLEADPHVCMHIYAYLCIYIATWMYHSIYNWHSSETGAECTHIEQNVELSWFLDEYAYN